MSNIKSLRNNLKMNKKDFAKKFHLSVKDLNEIEAENFIYQDTMEYMIDRILCLENKSKIHVCSTELFKNPLIEILSNIEENFNIFILDVEKDIACFSISGTDYFALPSNYVENFRKVWCSKVHIYDREVLAKDIDACIEGKKDKHDCQYRVQNKYGDYIWVESKGTLIKKNNKPQYFVCLLNKLENTNKYDEVTNLQITYSLPTGFFENKVGCVMSIDIRDFKHINSTYGYTYGNKVIKAFANVLEMLVGYDNVFRQHGDIFIIVLENKDTQYMLELYDKIQNTLKTIKSNDISLLNLCCDASIIEIPKYGNTYAEIMQNLDITREYIKNNSYYGVLVFNDEILNITNRINNLKEELTTSINNNFKGFYLNFQPIVDSKTKEILSCEALLRWKSDKIQDSNPGEFIPILEQSGQIIDVGHWVMLKVLEYASKWQPLYPKLNISFNVSALQLGDNLFLEDLINKSKELNLCNNHIIVELTESEKINDKVLLKQYISKLHEHNFKVALDDFGTEYASFGLLHDVDLDILKIDQKFVKGLSDRYCKDGVIVSSVINMCQGLNMHTVAEGIENFELQEKIEQLNVTFQQGYLYSKPLSDTDFEELLQTGFINPL